ncbi:MAG TPA: ADP-ribosylglycohydrolase family protein [Acidimicrobiia bacterium]|nr:ADP-ribosylglycohydrolase family protein [Acidimicrobiia bacterium]
MSRSNEDRSEEIMSRALDGEIRRPIGFLADRFRGALVGTGVGDALGAPVEGVHFISPSFLSALDRNPGPLRYTDDTHMTIGVATSLLECAGFDGNHMATTFARNFVAEPWRGYGPGPPEVFRLLRQGVPWDEAANSLYGGSGSFGNGAAMRVAPVALFAFPDLDRAAHIARRTAQITHAHPEGVDGAVVLAVAITAVLALPSETLPDATALVETARGYTQSQVFADKLAYIPQAMRIDDDGAAATVLGTGIAAHASVPTALYCFLRNPSSFREAIKTAIGMGGDADTIAAMTGALSGALLGCGAIPERWRHVEGVDNLTSLADQFHQLHTQL